MSAGGGDKCTQKPPQASSTAMPLLCWPDRTRCIITGTGRYVDKYVLVLIAHLSDRWLFDVGSGLAGSMVYVCGHTS